MQPFILTQKLTDFTDWLFPAVDKFPRAEKFALCSQIKNSVYEIMRLSIRAQKARNKLQMLYAADVELEMLRMLLRHAHTRKYLSCKKYELSAIRLGEIGKIMGGLIRSAQGRGSNSS